MRSVLSRSSSIDSDPSVKSISIDNDPINKSPNIDNIDPNIKTPVSRTSSCSNGGGAAPGGGTFLEFMRLRKKILMFREIFDIPPLNGSVAIHEVFSCYVSVYSFVKRQTGFLVLILIVAGDGNNRRPEQDVPRFNFGRSDIEDEGEKHPSGIYHPADFPSQDNFVVSKFT